MKKKKRVFSAILAAVMLISCTAILSGCGKKKSAGSEYVYVPQYIKIKGADGISVGNVRYANSKFYFIGYGGMSNGGGAVVYENGTAKAVAEPAAAVITDATGTDEAENPKPTIYSMDMDGNAQKLASYKPTAIPKGKEGSVSLAAYDVDGSGNLYVVEESYIYHFDLPAGFSGDEKDKYNYQVMDGDSFTLTKYGTDGAKAYQVKLNEVCGDENAYVNSLACDGSGNVYFVCNQSVYALDGSGKLLYKYDSTGWFDQLFKLSDGRVAVPETKDGGAGPDGSSTSSSSIMVMDNTAKTASVLCKLTNSVWGLVSGNATYGAIYTNGAYLYGLSTTAGTSAPILNWLSCNIDSDNITGVACLEDGRVACVTSENDDKTQQTVPELAILTKTKVSEAGEKKVLTLATQYLDYNLKNEVLKFNKTNPDYRIDVTDYSQYNTDANYDAGLKKMTTEILTGNVPDIIFTEGINIKQFVTKGVITDLDQFMKADKEITRSSVLDNIGKAMEIDGKLYEASPNFNLFTVIGNPSVVGDKMGWTVDDLNKALKKMPEGATVFDNTVTRPNILNQCLAMDMSDYVNWSTGECSFDKGGFQKLLEFANSFPSDFDWKNYDWQNYEEPSARVAAGKQMLIQAYIGQLTDYEMYKTEFGGKMTCVGFPTANGVGNMIYLQGGYAISSKCSDKAGAWQFVRTFLTKDYQESGANYGLPTNKDAFNNALKTAMTPIYMTDENGKTILDEKGNKVEQPMGSVYINQNKSINYYALTQADADALMTLMNSTTKVLEYDQSIVDIINDECKAYFDGQKSAEETAKLVQSRVSIYVNEQS